MNRLSHMIGLYHILKVLLVFIFYSIFNQMIILSVCNFPLRYWKCQVDCSSLKLGQIIQSILLPRDCVRF